jgi:outer membrane murein-binding lipoprotein Lpp
LHSVGANAVHGLRRSNDDKRNAVTMLLNDAEWTNLSDREIARACAVSHNFVSEVRKSICHPMTDAPVPATRTVSRNGTTYQQNITNIGKAAPANQPQDAVAELVESEPETSVENDLAPKPGDTSALKAPALLKTEEELHAEIEKLRVENDGLREEIETLREHNIEINARISDTLDENKRMQAVLDAHPDEQVKVALAEATRAQKVADTIKRQYDELQPKVKEYADNAVRSQNAADKFKKEVTTLTAKVASLEADLAAHKGS